VGCLCGCRRVLLFPKGNNVDHLSLYLDVADSPSLPYGWSRFAQFNLTVVNQYDSKATAKKGLTSLIEIFCKTPWCCGNIGFQR
jgi:hypothetical protein